MVYRFLLLFSLVSCFACVSESLEPTTIRCRTDADCDDDQSATIDRCGQALGMCHHTIVSAGCDSAADCNDGLTQTEDSCSEGSCHHTSTTSLFDPTSSDRQNAATLCESDVFCHEWEDRPYANLFWLDRCNWNLDSGTSWGEDGYRLGVNVLRRAGVSRVNVRLQMRVGDPNVRQRVTVFLYNRFLEPAIFEREMTVREIEHGVDLPIDGRAGEEDAAGAVFMFRLVPLAQGTLRTYQWALPVDGVRNAETGESFNRCLHVGRFVRLPEHGQLHLTESDSHAPQCLGTPLVLDEVFYPLTEFSGFARSRTSPEVVYLFGPRREINTFQGVLGLSDWLNPYGACGQIYVVSDELLAELHQNWTTRQIGIRPGIMVGWTDAQGVAHRGITDRNFVIRDFSPYLYVDGVRDYQQVTNATTSIYVDYQRIEDGRVGMPPVPRSSILDIQPYIGYYTVVEGVVPYRVPLFYPTMIDAYFFPEP